MKPWAFSRYVVKFTIRLILIISPKERHRINKLKVFEKELNLQGFFKICGVDEAGRGPLAGPVVAAAIILPKKINLKRVDDSKKVSEKNRLDIFKRLTEHENVIYNVSIIDHTIIDKINIHQASLLAMKKAVMGLKILPEYLLFDGRIHPLMTIPSKAIINGDCKSVSIAAASIIAKVTRDNIMNEYHQMYPNYGFNLHKGYGTEMHRKALLEFGLCAIHRRSFEPVKILT